MSSPPEAPSFGGVAAAFLRRDLAVAVSYRLGFVLRVLTSLVTLASFAAMARYLEGERGERLPGGMLGFWVVGIAMAELFHVSVSALSTRVRQAQVEGTLEAVLSTPATAGHVVVASSLYDLLSAAGRFALYLAAGGVLIGVDFARADVAATALAFALAIAAFVGVGLVGGALTMRLRRTDPISALAWMGAAAVGGVFYPVEALPEWLRPVSHVLPIAPALEALRAALFAGTPVGELARPLVTLAGFALVTWPLGGWLFQRALARARADGSLGLY